MAFRCDPGTDAELLLELLEEAIYLVDTHDAVPVRASVARTSDGALAGKSGVAARSDVALAGPLPNAVTRHRLPSRETTRRGVAGWSSTSSTGAALGADEPAQLCQRLRVRCGRIPRSPPTCDIIDTSA
jgi:hypothetical protein